MTLRTNNYLCIACLLFIFSCKNHHLLENSSQWSQIKHGEYLLENNTWNTQAFKNKWTQTIFCDTVKGLMGWRWDFSGEKDKQDSVLVKTFPEIIFGKKPYENYPSTTTRLPVALASAKFTLEYEYNSNATGVYNTSSDISFTDSEHPTSKNIRAKMMIWFDHQNFPFFPSEKLKTATIGGLQYKIFTDTAHIGPEGKWVFIALLADKFPKKGELQLKEYFDYFLTEGALKPEWYLSSIEVGSEISSGKGEIAFKKFVVH